MLTPVSTHDGAQIRGVYYRPMRNSADAVVTSLHATPLVAPQRCGNLPWLAIEDRVRVEHYAAHSSLSLSLSPYRRFSALYLHGCPGLP